MMTAILFCFKQSQNWHVSGFGLLCNISKAGRVTWLIFASNVFKPQFTALLVWSLKLPSR